MAERYINRRIGEIWTAEVVGGRLTGMDIRRDGDGVQAGDRLKARLAKKLGIRGIAIAGAEEILLEPWPATATEGADIEIEVTRSAWREPGRDRLAKARPAGARAKRSAQTAGALGDGWPDWLDTQWAEGFAAAELGTLPAGNGRLTFSPTPALLAVDVDGDGEGGALAKAALTTLAHAIWLWGLGGIIVIDLPQCDRAARAAATDAFDAAMAGQPHERTAINGFGLMQIILPRRGMSILERARLDRTSTEALSLLTSARRHGGAGPIRLVAPAAIIRWLESRPHLLAELSRDCGRVVDLRRHDGASGSYVENIS